MRVNAFTLAASSAVPLFIVTGAAMAGALQLETRLVDPALQIGESGSWAANGYPTNELDTYRVYAQFGVAANVLAVGDLFIGGTVMHLSTDAPTYFNAVGAFGNNGLRAPTDFTAIPGATGYTSQWDSHVTVGSGINALSPGLTTALGATAMGMGGLVGDSFAIDNTGWSWTPTPGSNTIFNAQTGFYEFMFIQVTVAEGFDVWGDNIVITTSTANHSLQSFHSIPAPGAIALLGLAGLGARRRRRE